ncbi:hypothetical protein PIB30_042727 [Stylosanthes scabra]|uniref:RRM domain-containing protein n=1 Tax=Stylosanthes scabra TaxID=79078 RepID=A0ABU6QG29_9FABA|nr:hypothetical protein [Stylosanthes scabra]
MMSENDDSGWQTYWSRRRRPHLRRAHANERGVSKWRDIERSSYSVFVDGLPQETAKGTLFKIFGWASLVTDVYISRKRRKGTNKLFAFVRFDSRGGAERAVTKLNSTFIGTARMAVKLAVFQRREMAGNQRWNHRGRDERSDSTQLRTNEVVMKKEGGKEIPSAVPEKKSIKTRDVALGHEGLCSLFFELRPQWGFSYMRSRRIWIEVTGVPIYLWSEDIFMKLGKLWGKLVMMNELTDYYLSYTCARILIDSFQWEMIHEWVTLEDGDKKFAVFVKEFGREIYSAQAHPETCHEDSQCRHDNDDVNGECNSDLVPDSVMAEKSERVAGVEQEGRRKDVGVGSIFWDPLIEDIIMKKDEEIEGSFGYNTLGDGAVVSLEEAINEST